MKNIISFILVASLSVSTILFNISTSYGLESISSVGTYTDIKSTNWAYEAVKVMSDKSIVKGYSDGTFKPSNKVSYGEFIKMALIASINEDVGNSTSGNWALSYYNKAIELGYFTDSKISTTQLNASIPRYDMALIISNILGDIKVKDSDALQQNITDVHSTTKNDYEIVKAYSAGILTGYPDKIFKPNGTLTRAEAVVVINRLVDDTKRVYPNLTEETITAAVTSIPLDQMITNYKSFYNEDGSIDETLSKVTSYKVDNSSYNMSLVVNNGIKNILIPSSTPVGARYLVKDNKIVEYMVSYQQKDRSFLCTYDSDITTIDYIAIVDGDYFMTLIPNPYKK